jgi:hypothetical protein
MPRWHTALCIADYWIDVMTELWLPSGMVPRRNVYDPLEPTREPRWYEVRDMHGRVLESRPLPAGTDLKRAFVAAMLEHVDAGWQLGEFGSRGGTFFCTRGTERRMVSITPTAPGTKHEYGAAHLTACPGHDD